MDGAAGNPQLEGERQGRRRSAGDACASRRSSNGSKIRGCDVPLEGPDGKRQLERAFDERPLQGALGDVREERVEPDGSVVVIALLERRARERMRMVEVPMDDGVLETVGARLVNVLGRLRRERGERRRGR